MQHTVVSCKGCASSVFGSTTTWLRECLVQIYHKKAFKRRLQRLKKYCPFPRIHEASTAVPLRAYSSSSSLCCMTKHSSGW